VICDRSRRELTTHRKLTYGTLYSYTALLTTLCKGVQRIYIRVSLCPRLRLSPNAACGEKEMQMADGSTSWNNDQNGKQVRYRTNYTSLY